MPDARDVEQQTFNKTKCKIEFAQQQLIVQQF